MTLNVSMVGCSSDVIRHEVTSRWTMAFAASIEDFSSDYMDSGERALVVAHPVFPVCVEWPALKDCGKHRLLDKQEMARGVHSRHFIRIFRPIESGETLFTTATVVSISKVRSGASEVIRFTTIDQNNNKLCESYMEIIYLGVELEGEGTTSSSVPFLQGKIDTSVVEATFCIPVREGLGNIYSECARIWNPIHCDHTAARSVGIGHPILHGTAVLAKAVSRLISEYQDGDSSGVCLIGVNFVGMVYMPSKLNVVVHLSNNIGVHFSIFTEESKQVVKNGYLGWNSDGICENPDAWSLA